MVQNLTKRQQDAIETKKKIVNATKKLLSCVYDLILRKSPSVLRRAMIFFQFSCC